MNEEETKQLYEIFKNLVRCSECGTIRWKGKEIEDENEK